MAALPSNSRVGHYEILGLIGAGGMGEVYRSLDTKLKREVAIKILPAAFSHDPDRLVRFRREAEVLATLNHPSIAQIYGLEESSDTLCLVLEMVEGETLADRLRRGAMTIDETLRISSQIAEALEAAHGRDIVHRDLKPANIKITPDGHVKVLDFGLAKPFASVQPPVDPSHSPTVVTNATMPGVILGTAPYMSPEQINGQDSGPGTDIWAFGGVLFEMLTGRQAFVGDSVVEILGGILKSQPDWSLLPPATPPAVVSLLKRCLQKDRSRRMRDIADARFQIEEALSEPVTPPVAAAPSPRNRERLLWIAVTIVFALSLAISMLYTRSERSDLAEMRLEIATPGGDVAGFAISPDGRTLVFQATIQGKNQLWLRPLNSDSVQALAGTDGGVFPFWSSDSKSVGFFADGMLKRIDVDSGLVQALAEAPLNTRGGAWGPDGTILFTRSSVEPLYRVPASGGKAVPATEVEAKHLAHRFPHFLPDGRHFLFFAYGPPENQGIYVGSLDSKDTKRLIDAESAAVFVLPDYVLFAKQGAILAQRIDLARLQPIGDPISVARQVATPPGTVASVALSAAPSGPVVFRADPGERQIVWVDRSGREIGVLTRSDVDQQGNPRMSSDARMVALTRMVSGNYDVWLVESARDVQQRFTSDPAREFNPIWSHDGSRLAFGSTRKGPADIYEKAASGTGPETLLWESPNSKNPMDWSPDGRQILVSVQDPKTALDIWVLSLDGEKKPQPLIQTPSNETAARFSPDGKWIAFQSNLSGRSEVYVQPFPGPGPRAQISTGGGQGPEWGPGGKELVYVSADNKVMSVTVMLDKPKAESGTPVPLFSLPPGATYSASPDGHKFLINKITREPAPVTILLNWKPR